MRRTVAVLALLALVVAAIGVARLPVAEQWADLLGLGLDRARLSGLVPPGTIPERPVGPRRHARRLLQAGQWEELTRAVGEAQEHAAADPSREGELDVLLGAFGVTDPQLTPRLDAWVAAQPDSFAPYLARARHRFAHAFAARGAKAASRTSPEQRARMRELLVGVSTDADAALERHPDLVEAYAQRIAVARATGDTQECMRLGREGLTHHPASERLRTAMSRCLLPRWGGSWAAVESLAREAQPHLARNPRLAALAGVEDWDRGRELLTKKRFDDALPLLDRAIAAGAEWQYYESRANLHLWQDRNEAALADAERGLALSPENPALLLHRVRALQRLGRRAEAVADVHVLRELDPANPELARYCRWEVNVATVDARDLIEANVNLDGAVARLSWALEIAGPDPKTYFWRGRAQIARGDRDLALADLDAAIAADPRYLDAYKTADWVLVANGDWQGIIQRWNHYLDLEPDDAEALFERAGAHKHVGNLRAARADVVRACQLGLQKACDVRRRL